MLSHVKCFAALVFALTIGYPCHADWLTYGHDSQRSGWAPEETKISPENASSLRLKWSAKLENESFRLSALTAPIVATRITIGDRGHTVVYVAGIKGTVFALDADTGSILWTHTFRSSVLPGKGRYQGTFLCPNGITATPVVDRRTNILYLIAPNGALYGLDLGTGALRYGPVHFVAAYAKSWSLNLSRNTIYTALAQGCGDAISGFYSIDISDAQRPVIRELLLSHTDTAGIWGRSGPIVANDHLYGATADGVFNPDLGDYSLTVFSASLPDLEMDSYFLPHNWEYLNHRDLDLGANSPLFFTWHDRQWILHGSKESVLYIFDADHLGGSNHQTFAYKSPRFGNDKQECCVGHGFYGAMATAPDDEGNTWIYAPLGGAYSATGPKFPLVNGSLEKGSILAFRVTEDAASHNPQLEPAWITGGFDLPDPPIVANGVVYALSTGENAAGTQEQRLLNTHPAILRALDAKTGRELFNSASSIKSWVHFSGLAIADGMLFAVDHDSNVYCFGLPEKNEARKASH